MSIPTSTTLYGNVITRQCKAIVISKVKKLTGFKYPIDTSPLRGYFTKQSGDNLIKTMIKTLIRTQRGERFMLPDYGCNLRKYLLEPLDETTFNLIRKEVSESVLKYLKNVKLNKIQVFENGPGGGFDKVLRVRLFARLRDEANNNLDINIKV